MRLEFADWFRSGIAARIFGRVPALGVFEVLKLNDNNRLWLDHALQDLESAGDDNRLAPTPVSEKGAIMRRAARAPIKRSTAVATGMSIASVPLVRRGTTFRCSRISSTLPPVGSGVRCRRQITSLSRRLTLRTRPLAELRRLGVIQVCHKPQG